MNTTQRRESRKSEGGFVRATIVSLLSLGVLVAMGLVIAGGDSAERAAEKPGLAAVEKGREEGHVYRQRPPITVAEASSTQVEGEEAVKMNVEVPAGAAPPKAVTYAEAQEAYHNRRYEEAAELFTSHTTDNPENVWGFYMLGLCHWKNGEPAEAEEAWTEALTIQPGHVKSLVNLARVRIEQERAKEALEPLREAIDIDPQNADAYRVLGRAAHSLNLVEEATYGYEEALKRNSDDLWALNNLGLLLIEQERFEEAIGPLARATLLNEDVAVFQNNLGIALERTGHLTRAAEAYGRALEIDESYEKAAASLARVEELEEEAGLPELDLATIGQGWSVPTDRAKVAQSSR